MHQEDLSLCFPVHSCCDLDEEGVYGEILTYRFAGEENGAFSLFLIRGCFCKSNSMCIVRSVLSLVLRHVCTFTQTVVSEPLPSGG
ncbi:hypothetical protein TNIN_489001 [Trichonephila inaurata madagascariensis]|uniref:Uncharacterized protein n=1 Tax=Trichonephila inaurata madagascariensis TaxID=2747483 RepID=A0A8X6JX72_9ARAC|nr:hypothetical protein TNIN_489001 [Trichonephila inaurata madagascariensis]